MWFIFRIIFGFDSELQTGKSRSCISCQEMKLWCRTEVTDTALRVTLKRSAKKDGEVGPVPKRQRTTGSEIGVSARSTEESITDRVVWGNMVKALERIGAQISELAGLMERLREEMKEVAKAAKASEQTQ